MLLIHNVLKVLSNQERKQAFFVLLFVTFSAVIETIGVASILPFLSVLAKPDLIQNNTYINMLAEYFNVSTQQDVLFVLGCLALVMLVISNGSAAVMNWMVSSFSHMRAHSLSCRILNLYLHQPYEFFLQRLSSDIAKNILSEVSQVVKNVIVTSMHLIARVIVSVCIFIMLIFVDPVLAISVMCFMGGAYIIVYLCVRGTLTKIGELRMSTTAERYNILAEIFRGIKDIKISALEDVYEKKYDDPSYKAARSYAQYDMISIMPRYIMETISFGGVLLIILYLLGTKGGIEEALPIIGLYAFAGQKLLPALQTIFLNASKIKFGMPSLDLLIEELELEKYKQAQGRSVIKFGHDIRIDSIAFSYKQSQAKILDNVSMVIKRGEKVGLVGATGAGKSTFIDVISNIIKPDQGVVAVDGVLLDESNRLAWSDQIGYVSQSIILFNDSIARNIALGVAEEDIDIKRIEYVSKIAELDAFVKSDLNGDYNCLVGENGVRLSGGQRQRIGLARALYKLPRLLILDEATSALDNITEAKIIDRLEEMDDLTIIMIAHRLSTIKNCDTIYMFEKGRIIDQGNFESLMDSSKEFKALAQTGGL